MFTRHNMHFRRLILPAAQLESIFQAIPLMRVILVTSVMSGIGKGWNFSNVIDESVVALPKVLEWGIQ